MVMIKHLQPLRNLTAISKTIVSSFKYNSAVSQGKISKEGGANITAEVVCRNLK